MADYTLADLQAAAPRVLARLRAMATFSEHGTVAGQAVASVFLEELDHAVRGPINDVDVFVSRQLPRTLRGLEPLDPNRPKHALGQRAIGRVTHAGGIQNHYERYSRIKFIALRATTRILRTYQAGLVNYTLVDHPSIEHGEHGYSVDVAREIVGGFDINAVGVGIHLDTGHVVASRGFIEFLNTSKLAVSTCNTPAHTLLRLAKKHHGGELPGASCDWEGERRMLEMAIACQAAQGHSDLYVLEFGSRFKALHDRFAQWLPDTTSRWSKGASGEDPYLVHALVPGEPRDEIDAAFLEQARKRGEAAESPHAEPQVASRLAYAIRFPEVYALLHPERTNLPAEILACRRQCLARWNMQATAGQQLGAVLQALGEPVPEIKMDLLDEGESLKFFFGQYHGRSPEAIEATIRRWNDWGTIEKHLAAWFDLDADDVVKLMEDPEEHWPAQMARGGGFTEALATMPGGGGPDGAFEGEMHRFCEQILGWAEKGTVHGLALAKSLAPIADAGTGLGPHAWSAHGLFRFVGCFPENHRAGVADRILRWACPRWPDLSSVTPKMAADIICGWAQWGSVPLPKQALEGLPEDARARILLEMGARGQPFNDEAEGNSTSTTRAVVAEMLSGLSGERLADHRGRLLRAALRCAPEAVFGLLEDPRHAPRLAEAVDLALALMEGKEEIQRRRDQMTPFSMEDSEGEESMDRPVDPFVKTIKAQEAGAWVSMPDSVMARLRANTLERRLARQEIRTAPRPTRGRM